MATEVESSKYSVVSTDKIKNFQDLAVWKKSHNFVLEIYKISSQFPKDELYGVTSQIRRASVSIPANISEGFSRKSNVEKSRFYNIAQTSLQEVKYYLILIKDLGYISSEVKHSNLIRMADEIGRMLHGLTKSLPVT